MLVRRCLSILMVGGLLGVLVGVIFALQGLGLIGPSRSFMVGDNAWVAYGLATASVGSVITTIALVILRSDKTA